MHEFRGQGFGPSAQEYTVFKSFSCFDIHDSPNLSC